MPELPEVETIRRGLEQNILHKKIVEIAAEKSFQKKLSPKYGKFIDLLEGNTFQSIGRRSKLLIFEINENLFLLIHLKMTGQLIYRLSRGKTISGGHPIPKQAELPSKFTRVQFVFGDKSRLFFNDVRKFGFLKLVDKK